MLLADNARKAHNAAIPAPSRISYLVGRLCLPEAASWFQRLAKEGWASRDVGAEAVGKALRAVGFSAHCCCCCSCHPWRTALIALDLLLANHAYQLFLCNHPVETWLVVAVAVVAICTAADSLAPRHLMCFGWLSAQRRSRRGSVRSGCATAACDDVSKSGHVSAAAAAVAAGGHADEKAVKRGGPKQRQSTAAGGQRAVERQQRQWQDASGKLLAGHVEDDVEGAWDDEDDAEGGDDHATPLPHVRARVPDPRVLVPSRQPSSNSCNSSSGIAASSTSVPRSSGSGSGKASTGYSSDGGEEERTRASGGGRACPCPCNCRCVCSAASKAPYTAPLDTDSVLQLYSTPCRCSPMCTLEYDSSAHTTTASNAEDGVPPLAVAMAASIAPGTSAQPDAVASLFARPSDQASLCDHAPVVAAPPPATGGSSGTASALPYTAAPALPPPQLPAAAPATPAAAGSIRLPLQQGPPPVHSAVRSVVQLSDKPPWGFTTGRLGFGSPADAAAAATEIALPAGALPPPPLPSLGLVGGTRVRSLLVRKDRPSSPGGACAGGVAAADGRHVARLNGVAAAAAAAVACGGGMLPRYVPVTRARMLSVKVHEPPVSFLEFAPTACERIQAYLRSTAATAATAAGGGGGAGMGGGGGVLASIGSLAVQGCVQVVSWVQTLSYGGGPGDARANPGGGDAGGGGGGAMANIECYRSYRVRPLGQQPQQAGGDTHARTRTHSQLLEALPHLGAGLGPVDVQADGLVASFDAAAIASASAAATAAPVAMDTVLRDASCGSTSSCGGRKSSSSDAERSTVSFALSRTSTAGLSDRGRAFCDHSLVQQQQKQQQEQQRQQEGGVEEVVAGFPRRRGRSLDYGVGASTRHVGSSDLLITWAATPCTPASFAEQQEQEQASQGVDKRQDASWAPSLPQQQQQQQDEVRGGTTGSGWAVGLRRSSSGPVQSVRELSGGSRAYEGALARRSEGRATGEERRATAALAATEAGEAGNGPAAESVELLWVQPCVLVAPGWGEGEEEDEQLRNGDSGESNGAAASPNATTQLIEVCMSAPDGLCSPAGGSGDSGTVAVRLLLVSYDMHVVVDEHVQLHCGAVSVVTLAVAVPPGGVGALRLLVLAPAAAHGAPLTAATGALGGGGGDGGDGAARVLVHATAAVLCLPRAVAEEMNCVVEGAAAAAAEATAAVTAAADLEADVYGQQMAGFFDTDGGGDDDGDGKSCAGGGEGGGAGPAGWAESPLSLLWGSFLGPFCADFAFLLDVASRGGHGVKGWRADSGAEGLPRGALQGPGPALGGGLLGDPRAAAAAMGLTAVFEHLRSALEPLGAEATCSFLAQLTTAAARAVLWGEQPPTPTPPQQQQQESYHSPRHTLPATPSSTPEPVSAPLLRLPTSHLQHQLCAWPTSLGTLTGDAAASHSPMISTTPGSSTSTSPIAPPPTAPPSPPRGPQQQQHHYQQQQVAGVGSAPPQAQPPQQSAQAPASCAMASSFASASGSTAVAAAAAAAAPSKGAPDPYSPSFYAAYAAALLSDRRQLLLTPLNGFRPVAYHQNQHQQLQRRSTKSGAENADCSGGGSSLGVAAGRAPAAAAAPPSPPGLEQRYERYTARAYRGLDLAAFALLVAMFAVVTWRKLRLAAAGSAVPLLVVGGVKLPYNIVMLWVVASTVMLPYYLQLASGRTYERCRERLHVVSQVVNAVVYGIFAAGVLPMPSEMAFHWNHSHVLQRGLVRPIRRPVRFRTHVLMLVVEVLGVTPAFLAYSGWRATLSTTLTTYSLSVAVGYALDLAMRRVFLHSLLMAGGGARVGVRGHGHVSSRGAKQG